MADIVDDSRILDAARALDASMMGEDAAAFAKEMVNSDAEIPVAVRETWWGHLGKDSILTKTNSGDEWHTSNDYAIARNYQNMAVPAYTLHMKQQAMNEQTRRRIMLQNKRSRDGFERTSLTTQVKELITKRALSPQGPGLWGSFKTKIGLGPKEELHAGS